MAAPLKDLFRFAIHPRMQPIVTITLSLDETRDLHRAMLTRYLMEDALRREQGLEAVDLAPLAKRLEAVIGISADQSGKELDRTEDELWQHAWLAYTDEWAWHRAHKDVKADLTAEELAKFSQEQVDRAVEQRYKEKFDAYLREVELPGHENGQTDCTKRERLSENQKPTKLK